MWEAILGLYHVIFYQPIFNALIFIYNILPGHDLAVAILVLTLVVRLVLWPLSRRMVESQIAMQELQPKIAALKSKYPKKEDLAAATMRLYKEEKVNPASSCLPLLIQLPFIIALFSALHSGIDSSSLGDLYLFIHNPGTLNTVSLFGLLDVHKPNILLSVLLGAAQFWQGHMLLRKRPKVEKGAEGAKDEDFAVMVNQQMAYIMPIVFVFITYNWPAGATLYLLATTVLSALQQLQVKRRVAAKRTLAVA